MTAPTPDQERARAAELLAGALPAAWKLTGESPHRDHRSDVLWIRVSNGQREAQVGITPEVVRRHGEGRLPESDIADIADQLGVGAERFTVMTTGVTAQPA